MLINEISEELSNRGYSCEIQEIAKTNGPKTGLVITLDEGSVVAPTVYDDMIAGVMEPGMGVSEVADRILDFVREHAAPDFDPTLLTSKEFLLDNAELAICKSDWNKEMLKDIPHQKIEDLSVYVRVRINSEASYKPPMEVLDKAGISRDEILKAAEENTKKKDWEIRSLQEILCEMMGMDPEAMGPEDNRFLMVSNEERVHGAVAICNSQLLDQAKEMLGASSIYIIPSSVHEILVLSTEEINSEDLNAMICQVNEEVEKEERLSDHAYRYNGQKLEIVQTNEHEIRRAGRSR